MNFLKKVLATFVIGAAAAGTPAFSAEEDKGIYVTGSVGYSKILDIDIENFSSDLKFDGGVGFDLGLGYDFGKNFRVEATWDRTNSGGAELAGISIDADTVVNSYLASVYYDFDNSSKWTPFLGGSIGSVSADVDGETASSLMYGLQGGLSYEATEKLDIFGKISYLRSNDLDYSVLINVKAPVLAFRLGARYAF